VFFAWGEIYSLFPSTCTDSFGAKFASANAGLLYTAKGTASLLVPLTSILTAKTGGWEMVFWIAAGMNAIAAIMALAVLKPVRMRLLASHRAGSRPDTATAPLGAAAKTV
jgi:OFA family oxalate/formate antiporter-like MFS transporter